MTELYALDWQPRNNVRKIKSLAYSHSLPRAEASHQPTAPGPGQYLRCPMGRDGFRGRGGGLKGEGGA